MPRPKSNGLFLVGLAVACLSLLAAHAGERITVWRANDGLPQSSVTGISLGPRGRVLATHSATLPVSLLDGFQVTSLSNTVGAPTRVYESRSEQYWCTSPEGLLEQTGQSWTAHPVPEIAAEFRASPIRSIRPIPLLPLDRNHILVLLPDRLIEYDTGQHRTTLLQRAGTTRLDRFNDLAPANDDGVWVSGARGLLHLAGPLRQLRPDTRADVYLVPEEIAVTELQRPSEDASGTVTMTAEATGGRGRVVVQFAHGVWKVREAGDQNLRQAWTGADGTLYAHTASALLRLEPAGASLRSFPILQVGRIADSAIGPRGTAWLATSEGLFRVAPMAWRPAVGFPSDSGPVLAATTDRRGRVVAATETGVHWRDGSEWRFTPWNGGAWVEPIRPGEILFPLPDGGCLARRTPANEQFAADGRVVVLDAALRGALPLGTLPDGRILLATDGPEADPRAILAYDGTTTQEYAGLPATVGLGRLSFALQSRSGELWLGGERGLVVRRGNEWTEEEPAGGATPDRPAADGALAGVELPDGRLWVGGADTIREFDGRRWTILRRGLDHVHTIVNARDGVVWVASDGGVHRFREGSWLTLGEDEGLPSSAAYAAFEDGSGRIWAATGRGLSTFDAQADTEPPQVTIVGSDIPERAGDRRALFVVGGEDRWRYSPPGRLLFSWRLDNSPWSPWRFIGSVQFTNLAAGTHEFQVRGIDPSGNVQTRAGRLEFDVALAWFRDPRLVAMSAVLGLLALALGLQAWASYHGLKRSYAEVERQVAERTAALEKANAELLHSQKMRALGTLAAGVAHDFNNLLSIIRGSAQLAESHLDDQARARQRLERIKTAVDQGAALVKAMLGYSRGAMGPRKELDLEDVVEDAVRLLEERLGNRLVLDLPNTPLPRIRASPEMLQQILLNLVVNADEAMEHQGEVRVRLSVVDAIQGTIVLNPAPAARHLEIAVIDRGIGIPPENLSRIFEPFFTTKGFSSRRGTGLGLSMAYEFAKELGAGLAVESVLGQGSTFRILLPVGVAFASATPPTSPPPAGTPGSPNGAEPGPDPKPSPG